MMTTMPPRQFDNAETETNYGFVSGSGSARAVAPGIPDHIRHSALPAGGSDLAAREARLPGNLASGSERAIGDPEIHIRAESTKLAQQRSEV